MTEPAAVAAPTTPPTAAPHVATLQPGTEPTADTDAPAGDATEAEPETPEAEKLRRNWSALTRVKKKIAAREAEIARRETLAAAAESEVTTARELRRLVEAKDHEGVLRSIGMTPRQIAEWIVAHPVEEPAKPDPRVVALEEKLAKIEAEKEAARSDAARTRAHVEIGQAIESEASLVHLQRYVAAVGREQAIGETFDVLVQHYQDTGEGIPLAEVLRHFDSKLAVFFAGDSATATAPPPVAIAPGRRRAPSLTAADTRGPAPPPKSRSERLARAARHIR